jgi:hypothetical protein
MRERAKRLRRAGESEDDVGFYDLAVHHLLSGLDPLPSLEQVANLDRDRLGDWYQVVYRFACEPAHLTDWELAVVFRFS